MKILNDIELTEYIQDRQAKQVRALRQAHHVIPKLVILQTDSEKTTDKHVQLLKKYGTEISIDVEVFLVSENELTNSVKSHNNDPAVHGIFLPYSNGIQPVWQNSIDVISTDKDVSGRNQEASYDSILSLAIDWLLAGYNVEMRGKDIVIIGNDNVDVLLLAKRWQTSGLDASVTSPDTENLADITLSAEILVSVANRANLITPEMIKPNVVIVDAGLSEGINGLVGDVSPRVYDLPNVTITSPGDGITTIKTCALFDNVIQSARKTVEVNE